MIPYLIKMTLCALALYAVYDLILEREKMHRFKRFYLLGALVFSIVVPFVVWTIDVAYLPVKFVESIEETVINRSYHHFIAATTPPLETISPNPRVNYPLLLLMIYTTITLFFLFRFIRNCLQMLLQVQKNEQIDYRGAKIIPVTEKVAPHSFGRFIFINREDYNNGLVPDEIIIHEWTHVRQCHTYDLLFIELLITFGWFNPVYYLYRNKIKQNHEYLADEGVVGNNKALIPNYQTLLINQIPQNRKINFISTINYSITKKRLVMMTKTTSKKRERHCIIALIPVCMAAICVFSTKTIAQNEPDTPQTVVSVNNPVSNNHSTLTPDLLQDDKLREYNQIIGKFYGEKDGKRYLIFDAVLKEDIDRLEALYLAMSPEQQSVLMVVSVKWGDEKTLRKFQSWKALTVN